MSSAVSDAPSYRELDAMLAAAEARTEARYAVITSQYERLTDLLTGQNGVIAEMKSVKADNRNTRWTILAIFAGSVTAGLAALWTTQANLLAAFQTVLAAHPPH